MIADVPCRQDLSTQYMMTRKKACITSRFCATLTNTPSIHPTLLHLMTKPWIGCLTLGQIRC